MKRVKKITMKRAKGISDIIPSDKQVVYIAGKVSNLPRLEVLRNFLKAEKELHGRGFAVINPVRLVHPEAQWQDAMRICISALTHANYIFLLSNWKDSEGAKLEAELADKLGIVRM